MFPAMKLQPVLPPLSKCHPLRVLLLQIQTLLLRDLLEAPLVTQAVCLVALPVIHPHSRMNKTILEDKQKLIQTPLGVMGATNPS